MADVNPGEAVLRKLKERLVSEAVQVERTVRIQRIGFVTHDWALNSDHAEAVRKSIDASEKHAAELRAQVAQLDAMREALVKIADHAGDDFNRAQNHRFVDEWTEAAAFTEVRRIAREVLGRCGDCGGADGAHETRCSRPLAPAISGGAT